MKHLNLKSLYEAAIAAKSWSIDFRSRTLTIDRKEVIKDGKTTDEDTILDENEYERDRIYDALYVLVNLYFDFCCSRPTTKSEARKCRHFEAPDIDDIDPQDMDLDRDFAEFRLEYFVLRYIMDGTLRWIPDFGDGWFFAPSSAPRFVLKREWLDQNYNSNPRLNNK